MVTLGMLYRHPMLTNDAGCASVNAVTKCGGSGKTGFKTHISNLRKKLRPFGVQIGCMKGFGYIMSAESKEIVAGWLP